MSGSDIIQWQVSGQLCCSLLPFCEALAAWRATRSVGPVPTSHVGIRSKSVSSRKSPKALLTYIAVAAGLLYGVLPLLYAPLHHLTTNEMTYVVSARGENVVFAVIDEVLQTSLNLRRSLGVATTGAPRERSSLHLARSRIFTPVGPGPSLESASERSASICQDISGL